MLMTVISAGVCALMHLPIEALVDYALGDQSVPGAVAKKIFEAAALEPNTVMFIFAAGVASLIFLCLNAALNWGCL